MEPINIILINPEKREIYATKCEPTLEAYYALIGNGCDMIEGLYTPQLRSAEPPHIGYVDEEGCLKLNHSFHIPPHSIICGTAIILGFNEDGEDIDCTLKIDYIKYLVQW